MEEQKCNAPCILTTTSAPRLVFCGEKHGHAGKHSLEIRGKNDLKALISWSYFNDIGRPFDPRELANVKRVVPSTDLGLEVTCEKNPQHEDAHTQSGICHFLNAWWTIVW